MCNETSEIDRKIIVIEAQTNMTPSSQTTNDSYLAISLLIFLLIIFKEIHMEYVLYRKLSNKVILLKVFNIMK